MGTGRPSTRTSSSTVFGVKVAFGRTWGSTTTTPRNVENQSRPDFVFKPAGKNPPVHSSDSIPSVRPKSFG